MFIFLGELEFRKYRSSRPFKICAKFDFTVNLLFNIVVYAIRQIYRNLLALSAISVLRCNRHLTCEGMQRLLILRFENEFDSLRP